MKNLINTSIKASNFKCFSTEAQGFEHIKPINIIVGKNNSGKSSLLETIQRLVTVNFKFGIDDLNKSTPSGAKPAFYITVPLDEEHITSVFSKTASGGSIPGRSHFDYGKQLIGLNITFAINDNSSNVYDVHIEGEDDITPPLNTIRNHNAYRTNLATRIHNPLNNFYYRRLSSERDIKLEQNNDGLTLNINGDGATNIIQNYINRSDLNRDIITKDILSGLNEIFKPDSYFTEITSRKGDGDFWQIYLSEKDKTLVPLINSGSGLKTILLVLLNIHVAPIIDKKPLKNYIFAFEELENNLHPALLRNLLKYLYTTHKENGCLFFLTTHSNVTIDVFSKNEDAQIIHVTHDRKNAQCDTATTYIHNKGILDDLDVRASDLLQSNCVV